MRKSTRIAAFALALFPLLASSALAWRAWNRHEVLPVSDGVFEVVAEVGSSATSFWCGAGDYAQRQLRAPAAQRIYIWLPVGPSVNRPGRKAVQFSLSAPPGADTTPGMSVTVNRAGDNMRTASAQAYCYDRLADNLYLPAR